MRFLALLALAATLPAQVRLVIVEPGHFHASLLQRDTYPQVSPRVAVYAPLGPDLLDYLNRVTLFNTRAENPTAWQLDVHTGPDFFDRMLADRPGNVVVFSGRNREKMGRIVRSLQAGLNVLADKPWIIASKDLPQLASALDLAEQKSLVAYDIMTERFEITSIVQKELVNTPEVFGRLEAVNARSIHYLLKTVAGVPLRRPSWFLNFDETGEGIADVGTHVVDLVHWTGFPDRRLDYRKDIQVTAARRWPTILTGEQFTRVTGEKAFPDHLKPWVKNGRLEYFANHEVHYTVQGVPIALDVRWDWEAQPGAGDLYEASFRGSRARVEIRQGVRPELYVVPVSEALRKRVAALGFDLTVSGDEAHILIPDRLRVTHEEHFAQVTRAFLGYLKDPKSLPGWEKSNMLVKYFITTKTVELSRESR